jgi:hypothetical protein
MQLEFGGGQAIRVAVLSRDVVVSSLGLDDDRRSCAGSNGDLQRLRARHPLRFGGTRPRNVAEEAPAQPTLRQSTPKCRVRARRRYR